MSQLFKDVAVIVGNIELDAFAVGDGEGGLIGVCDDDILLADGDLGGGDIVENDDITLGGVIVGDDVLTGGTYKKIGTVAAGEVVYPLSTDEGICPFAADDFVLLIVTDEVDWIIPAGGVQRNQRGIAHRTENR